MKSVTAVIGPADSESSEVTRGTWRSAEGCNRLNRSAAIASSRSRL